MAATRKKTIKTKTVKTKPSRPAGGPARPGKPASPAGKQTAKAAKPKTGKTSFKREIRQRLIDEKNKLLNEVSLKVKGESEGAKTEIGDIYDIASFERERELTLMLGDRERGKLVEIDKALERLNGKDYGVCEECGEPIGENRLMAMPFTMVCVDCKTRAEKELLIKGKVEEEPSFGILEKTEPEEEF